MRTKIGGYMAKNNTVRLGTTVLTVKKEVKSQKKNAEPLGTTVLTRKKSVSYPKIMPT